jgi:hypothetical protein
MATTSQDDLPLGTSPQFARMHTIIRRVCYVLLFGLVIEGALTFPLLAVWYGVPTLTPAEVCDELQKVMYDDDTRECRTADLDSPPLGGTAEAEDQTTAKDVWSVQPRPLYPRVGFRELVENKRRREAAEQQREAEDATSDDESDDSSEPDADPGR